MVGVINKPHKLKKERFSWLSCLGLYLFFSSLTNIEGQVISFKGSIPFDVDANGEAEMVLDNSGLVIGASSPSASLQVNGNIISQSLAIGSTFSQSSNLYLHGTMGLSFQCASTNLSLGSHSLVMADSSKGNLRLTLPDISSGNNGVVYSIKKISKSHTVTIEGQGVGNIEGGSSLVLNSGSFGVARLVSISGNWFLLSSSGAALSSAFVPTDLSSVTMWFDASDSSTIITTNGNVSGWNDKVGSNHLTQTTEADRPVLGGNINNLSTVAFNEDFMDLTTQTSTVRSIIYIANNLNGSNIGATISPILGEETNLQDHTFVLTNNTGYSVSIDGNNGGGGTAAYNGNTAVTGTDIDLGMSNDEKNGVFLGYVQYDNPQDVNYVGRMEASNTYKLIGDLGEIIFLDSSPTLSERQKLEGYLAHKWGVALPSGHPYKSSPP